MKNNELITICDNFEKINPEFNKLFAKLNEVIIPDIKTEKFMLMQGERNLSL
jgi:hypothetical protein